LRAPLAARDAGSEITELLRIHARILVALIIRDVQTRFFGTALGFIIAILWPVSHIFLLIFINGALGRPSPYGDSAPLFFATGLLPFMCFNYMSRFTCLGVMMNKPLLGFPIVKVADLLLARGILEVLNAAVVVIVTIVILTAMGVDIWPPRPLEAMYAMLACMTLGFGYGIVNGVISGIFPFWFTPFSLSQIVLWMCSGVIMVPDDLPESARYWLSFNPILIGVEWMRSAFYEGYGLNELLDKHYLIGFAAISILVGLLMERTMRGIIMKG
jgi:capsular polysaccharide transport system permease protein